MEEIKKCPKLSLHKSKFVKNGKRGALLEYHSLIDSEKMFLACKFFKNLNLNKNKDPYQIFAETLFEWGIMCPHPISRRKQADLCLFCNACGAYVLSFVKITDQDEVKPFLNSGGSI